jgi:hypothetical protein
MSILGIAAGALGVGGLSFFALRMFAPGILASIAAVAKSIPTKVWIGLAVLALLVVGYFVHQHKAHAALAAEYARGSSDRDKAWHKRLDAEHEAAMKWKAKADAASAKITQEIGARHDEEIRAIAALADDQRLRGPGQAAAPACSGSSHAAGLPGGSGGHVASGGASGSGVAGVPPEEPMAVVPWSGLVSVAERADGWRAEVSAWRDWYARQAEANRAAREAGPKPN